MKRRNLTIAASLAIGLLAGLIPSALTPVSAAIAIQPGTRISSGGSGCTMNFIYREILQRPTSAASASRGRTGSRPQRVTQAEPRLYAGTAGHCVKGAGARVSTKDGPFGTVAFSVLTKDGDAFDDVAFIEIDRDKERLVNPKMLGFNGPTGLISGKDAKPGDSVHVYGNGLLVGETELTRPRSGSLKYSDSNYYGATLPVIFGDSGGPVLHKSGAALGIVDHLVISADLTTLSGNTVERALLLAKNAGLNLELVTING